MQFTGPEHAAMAEDLLFHRHRFRSVADRLAAANVHAQLAHVALLAAMITEGDGEGHEVRAAEWSAALPVPEMSEDVDEALAEWTANPEG